MRIVLDGSPLTVETGGIRRYTEELAIALRALGHGDEVLLLSDRPLRNPARVIAGGAAVRDDPPRGWRKRWWSLGLASECVRWNASVFHGTDFAVPYLHRRPAVMTVHDLSPWRYPQWQPHAGRIRRRTPWMLRFGMADMVITVSQAVREEIVAHFRIPPDRTAVTPLAADERFHPEGGTAPPGLSAHRGEDGRTPPFFLFAGTLEPRKNLDTLLSAWKETWPQTRTMLVIAGRLRQDMQAPQPAPGLLWLRDVTDDQLVWLYAHAEAVVYPSHYEGFGLPVLEAMQCGAPVVISRAKALEELAGDTGLRFGADDPRGLGEALLHLSQNTALRQEQRERSLKRAAMFSWKKTAEATRMVYEEARRRFER